MSEGSEKPPVLGVEAIEVIRPVRSDRTDGPGGRRDKPAFHAGSAILLLVIDNLWGLTEFAIVDWFITVPLCFLFVFAGTWMIQIRAGDTKRRAALKALFLGIVAGVPFSVTGTPLGLALLAWAGFKHPWFDAKKPRQ